MIHNEPVSTVPVVRYRGGVDYPADDISTSMFDFTLPEHLIAQTPWQPRDGCKLLTLDRATGAINHGVFTDIENYLQPGDVLVVNETRVLPARLLGERAGSGGKVELLLLKKIGSTEDGLPSDDQTELWECLAKPGKKARVGQAIEFFDDRGTLVLTASVENLGPEGVRIVRLSGVGVSVSEAIHRVGQTPLPPYITQRIEDPELYQTVYAVDEHSAAAPTAGLHFTDRLLERLKDAGVQIATVRLDVGLDTFRPVSEEDPTQHVMHNEFFLVPQATVDMIERAKQSGGRVIAVGTTSARALESAYQLGQGQLVAQGASTELFIMPGYSFGVIDGLLTNFHVPRSTLMMMVSAFGGYDFIMNAYKQAIDQEYRFFSFGDAMLVY